MYEWLYLRRKRRLYSEKVSPDRRIIKIIYIKTEYDEEVEKIWSKMKRKVYRDNLKESVETDVKYLVEPFRFFGGPVKRRPWRLKL